MTYIAGAIARQERRKAKPARASAQPLPKPPEPPPKRGARTPLATRDLRPGSRGHYITKGQAGPGDDDDDQDNDNLNRSARP